jgi:4-hydroxy-tetrahydrodipicolinate reductase
MAEPITVVVSGAKGRMGREVVAAVTAEPDLALIGEVDMGDSLADILSAAKPLAMVDFSTPKAVMGNIETALRAGVVPIVGTTGMSPADLDTVRGLCKEVNLGALIVPNFSIGAILMMRFCQQAAAYLPDAEIIEMHHEQKMDAPSGTAVKTAEMIEIGRAGTSPTPLPAGTVEKIAGARGGVGAGKVPVHSVRLPGFMASQMVIFGGPGQTLTIRHDSPDRKCYMPGVMLAVRKAPQIAANGGELIYGLEDLM